MPPCSDNMMPRNGLMYRTRVVRSYNDLHRENFKKSEVMYQKSIVQELITVTQAKRTAQKKFEWIPSACAELDQRVGFQDFVRAYVFIGSVFAWAEGLLVLWGLPIIFFLSICLFPGKVYRLTNFEQCIPGSEEWDMYEQYPLIERHDVIRASITIGSMFAYAENLMPLWAVPLVMILAVAMFPGQIYGNLALFPAQEECLESSGDVFELYPTIGWQDMTRSSILIALIFGCAEGYVSLGFLPVLMFVNTCILPGQIYDYIASSQEDESEECMQSLLVECDVFEQYPAMGLQDMMRACIFIGLIFGLAEGYLPLLACPILMFLTNFILPGQIYGQLRGYLGAVFSRQLNASFQFLFNLLLRPAFHIDDDDDIVKGLSPKEKKMSDSQ